MPMRRSTVQNYKRKKSRQSRAFLKTLSNSAIKGRQASTVSDVKKGKPIKFGQALARNTSSIKNRQQIISQIDLEINKLFSKKPNKLFSEINKLSAKERQVVVKYASVRIAKVLSIIAKRNLSNQKNTSNKFSLSLEQKRIVFDLLKTIPSVNPRKLQQVINNQTALSLKIQEHSQFAIAQFFEKYVFCDNPRMSPKRAVERINFAIKRSGTFEEFYKYLNNVENKGTRKSVGKNKILRLSGLQIEIGKKQLIFSKGTERQSTLIHESIHNILNNSGLVELSWSESFTHFLTMVVSKKSNVGVDFISQRKKFDTTPHLAIANFPWENITMQDVNKLANSIYSEIKNLPTLKNATYYSFYSALTPKVTKYYFELLEKKLPSYSNESKQLIKQIIKKGLEDTSGKSNLSYLDKELRKLQAKLY